MRITSLITLALLLSACDKSIPNARPVYSIQIEQAAAARIDAPVLPLSPMAQVGKKIFFDENLSASGKMSCATCHSPNNAYAPVNALAAQLGGPILSEQGMRAVPTLTYHERTPPFRVMPDSRIDLDDGGTKKAQRLAQKKIIDAQVEQAIRAGKANTVNVVHAETVVPSGGFDWDGRAMSLADQASGPLFDTKEMANTNVKSVLDKLKGAAYADDLIKVFGQDALSQPEAAVRNAYKALAQFQLEDRSFHPYNSKFDFYLAGRVQLSEKEMRGLKLFDDAKKGNCAACHLDKPTKNRLAPVFTDYQFEALAAPRNTELLVNADPHFSDQGLCGPNRKDMAEQEMNCGLFKTPTLRNVATRRAFFHNGVFHSLEDVVRFYVERDTRPEKWYPRGSDGKITLFNDLPLALRDNVDVGDPPFNRHLGEQPALSEPEIKDVVAFLKTLTDGYK
jgi:cytochrome c peroxidase